MNTLTHISPLRRAITLAAIALPLFGMPALAQHDMSSMGGGQATIIRGFMDVDWLSGGMHTGRTQGFSLGQYDLFIASQLADRFSFQGETVFEFDEGSREFGVDVERVVLSYAASEHVRILGGKVHTPIGFWNNAYHHGLALQPTIDRPLIVHFEDDGGPLPIHTVGVQLSGRDLSPMHLGFDALLGNGLGNMPVADTSSTPSVTLALHSQITPSLRVGVSGYRAVANIGSTTPRGTLLGDPMTQTIAGGFVTYFGEQVEAIAEGQQVMNRLGGQTTTSPGWYAYAGVRAGPQLVPYVMHDQLDLSLTDPYFVPDRTKREILGVRWEQTASVVFKVEARSVDTRGRERASELGLQLAFAF